MSHVEDHLRVNCGGKFCTKLLNEDKSMKIQMRENVNWKKFKISVEDLKVLKNLLKS